MRKRGGLLNVLCSRPHATAEALLHVLSLVQPGAKVLDLCVAGDKFIEECVRAARQA